MAVTTNKTSENKAADVKPAAADANKPEETAKPVVDYIAQIGRNFNPVNAKELFGSKWSQAMDAVAQAGGYGRHTADDYALFDKKLFGGFAIPQGERFQETRDKINAALNGLD